MISVFKYYFTAVMFALLLLEIVKGSAFGFPITIDAIDDAGQYAGQDAYLKFAYSSGETPITTAMVPNQWTSRVPVDTFALDHTIPGPWHLESAGNIWSSDTIVGNIFYAPNAGIYRISPVGGAFTYDSFNWSEVAERWLWQLQIYAIGGANYTLGSQDLYDTADQALGANLGKYIDITLAEGGELIFWIADGNLGDSLYDALHRNSIDNSGYLTFNVTEIPTPVPEPSTLIFAGTGLLLLAGRYRKFLIRTY